MLVGYKTKIGCVITFLGGLVAVLTGAIAEPFDPVTLWGGVTVCAGSFAGWGLADKGQRILRALKAR